MVINYSAPATQAEDNPTTYALRVGDTLLLDVDEPEGTAVVYDIGDNGTLDIQGEAGSPVTITFDEAAITTVRAIADLNNDGVFDSYTETVAVLEVSAVGVDFDGPIACEVGFQREKGVAVHPLEAADTPVWDSNDESLLDVEAIPDDRLSQEVLDNPAYNPANYGKRLWLTPSRRGTPVLLARTPSGSVIGYQEVNAFRHTISSRRSLLINAHTRVGTSTHTIRPYVPGLRVTYDMFSSKSTFSGGRTRRTVSTDTFDQVYDDQTGETIGVRRFDIEVPQGEDSYCFRVTIGQQSRHGSSVAFPSAANGDTYDISIRDVPNIIIFNEDQEHEDYRVTYTVQHLDKNGDIKRPHPRKNIRFNIKIDGAHPLRPRPRYIKTNDTLFRETFPASRGREEYPADIRATRHVPWQNDGKTITSYTITYDAVMDNNSAQFEGETKVVLASLGIDADPVGIAVDPGTNAAIEGADEITIDVIKGEANSESWQFIGDNGGLELRNTQSSGAEVIAAGGNAPPGGPYTVEVSANDEPQERARISAGVGAAEWEAFEDDGAGPIVMGGEHPMLVVRPGRESSVKLKTFGSKVNVWVKVSDDSPLIVPSGAHSAGQEYSVAIGANGGVTDAHYADGVQLETGTASQRVDYPGSFNVRVYTRQSRTVIPAFVYYTVQGDGDEDESNRIYYATGTNDRPTYTFTGSGISEPYLQQMNIAFSVGDPVEIEFGDEDFAEEVAGGWDRNARNDFVRRSADRLREIMGEGGGINHLAIILGAISGRYAFAAVGGPLAYYPNNPDPRAVAHELGHNLGIGADDHVRNTFMNEIFSNNERTDDAIRIQLDTIRPVE